MDSSLWHNQSFLRLWIAQAVSNAGSKVTEVALPLTAVVVLSATPAQMGLLSMAGSLPNLLIGLPAGVWIDRSRRRPILVGADVGRALLLGSIPAAAWLGGVTFLHLWIVAFLAGILSVFFQIAAMAVLPAVVSKEQLVEANSKLSMTDSVIALSGSGAAGTLVQLLSAPKAILVDAISYVLSALALGGVGENEETPARTRQSIWREVWEGVHELVRTPLLRMLTITSTLGVLSTGLHNTVQMLFFVNELQFSPALIGLILSFNGGGSLAGAAVAGRLANRLRVGNTLVLGKLIWIAGSALVVSAGFVGNALIFVSIGQVLIGLGISIYFINQLSLRQVITSVRLLGRVTAARRFVLFGVAVLGAALGGYLGETVGLRATMLAGILALCAELLLIVNSSVRQAQV
ncbi:MAG: MFS transporter [Caldilineaceae bacterium]